VIELNVKATSVGANVIGGLLFGAGWAIVGYCPGTALGALGEGRWHAVWAILGMLAGAAVYAEVYLSMKETVVTWGSYGKVTLPQALGTSPWFVIPVLVVFFLLLFSWFEKKGL
jgi:uncharacterized membrane protein YedE/YeeE